MATSVLSLPVSVEQIATAIRQMSKTEQQKLLALVPELRQEADVSSARTMAQMKESVLQLQTEVLAAINHQPLSPNSSFLGDMTLDQYHALPEAEKTRLWDKWADSDLLELDEHEVAVDALPAR